MHYSGYFGDTVENGDQTDGEGSRIKSLFFSVLMKLNLIRSVDETDSEPTEETKMTEGPASSTPIPGKVGYISPAETPKC